MPFRLLLMVFLFAFQAFSQAPFRVAWNAAGDKLAYYQSGVIWVMNTATAKKKSLAKLDIADECGILWPSAALVLACPLSLTGIDPNTGRSKLLLSSATRMSDPQVSPDGSVIGFVQNHNLASIRSSGGEIRKLTNAGTDSLLSGEPDPLYAHEFHLDRAYWWAPDSSAIAYLETDRSSSGAYPQAGKPLPMIKLKVLTLSTGNVTEVASGSPDQPYLAGVAWLPDSKQLAYQVLNRLQNQLDMSIYDIATSASRQIYSEKDPYWINLPGAPVFTDDGGKFLITSERTGSRHAYLYSTEGKLEADLTPGKIEVTGPLNPHFYFSALTGNMLNLQLYGKNQELLTKEPGWHQTSISPNYQAFVDEVSTADSPPSVSLRRIDGSVISVLSPAKQVTVPPAEFSNIKLHDDVHLPAMTWKPAGFDPSKKYPVILYTLSGPSSHVVKNAWGGWQNAWNREMSQKGYIVMAVDARGSGGYGHYFEEYIHYRMGAQELADLREVFAYLSRLPYVDAKRIGIWGCDYGAHTVVHAMLEFPNGFAAGFADSPITNWNLYNAYFTERYLGLPAHRYVEYDDSSPLGGARRLQGKLLVASSPADNFIKPDQLAALQKALDKAHKPFEVLSFPNADYRSDPASLEKLMKRMADFFAASL